MLYKNEIAGIPLLPIPSAPKNKTGYYHYLAAAEIYELPRSGRLLVTDIYGAKDEKFVKRFVTDGKNFASCDEWPADRWGKAGPKGTSWYGDFYSTPENNELAMEFLGVQNHWRNDLIGLLDDLVSGYNYELRSKRENAVKALKEKHFAMYPKLPDNLEDWCDEHLFHGGYIFFTKKNTQGVRRARCGVCGHEFEPASNVKHNQHGRCPECGRPSVYKAEWIRKMVVDTKKLCLAERVDGNLLIRWMNVWRKFGMENFKKSYSFTDTNYNLHISTSKGITIYSYRGCAYGGDRRKNGEYCSCKSMVYTDNLKTVFGERYHGVDISAVAAAAGEEMNLGKLLHNLEKYPHTEYLLKMGLTALADSVSALCTESETGRRGFSAMLGVSKQLLPVYQSMNVSLQEHRIIRAYGSWVSEEDVENLRRLRLSGSNVDAAMAVLQQMSMQKFNNYFWKQRCKNPDRSAGHLVTEYRDYLEMSMILKIDLAHKSVRYPSDLVTAHSRLLSLFNSLDDKDKAVDEAFAAAVTTLYEQIGFQSYEGEDFSVVFPQVRSDLIVEGQSLNHCVGRVESYYKNHMAGTKMIFFVRRLANPEKPFFTMEVDMKDFRILQLYGFGDCTAPPKVRKFAERFTSELRKAMKKGRKAA